MTRTERFPIQVFYSEEDQGYIAIAPDIPGSSAFGETQEGAVQELKLVIGLALDAIQAAGNPLPQPGPPPQEEYSGKVLLRLPKSQHAKLARRAKDDGVSLNTYINFLLAEENVRTQQLAPATARGEWAQNFRNAIQSTCLYSHVETTSTEITGQRLWNFESPRFRELQKTGWTDLPANKPVIRK